MMILWISIMFLGSLCAAQNNLFLQSAVGGSTSASSGQLPRVNSFSGVSASSSAGSSGASASAQVNVPQVYPICLASNPDDAVKSSSPFAYSLLEASFSNPFLKGFYNTSFDTARFYDAIIDELKETLPKSKSQDLAGSLALLFESALPKLTPILNAVSITNALNELQGEEAIVISNKKEEYIEPFLSSLSKAVSDTDGGAADQASAVVSGLLGYLDKVNALTYSKMHEFVSILSGEYRLAIYSTCKPSNFETIPVENR